MVMISFFKKSWNVGDKMPYIVKIPLDRMPLIFRTGSDRGASAIYIYCEALASRSIIIKVVVKT